MKRIEELQISNIRIFCGDGRNLIANLRDHVLQAIFLLFPDPWPKKKHHKRRIFTQQFLNLSMKKLKSSGKLIVATDHCGYFNAIEKEIKINLNCAYEIFDDLSKLLLHHTKYQKKSSIVVSYFEVKPLE